MGTKIIQYGVHCIYPSMGEAPCQPFYVGMDSAETTCPDCGKEVDLHLFRIANRTIIIGHELLDNAAFNYIGFNFADFLYDDDRTPAEFVAGNDYDAPLADFSISGVNCKRDLMWSHYTANLEYGRDTTLFLDVFTHATHPLAGEEYLPQGSLAPLLAGVQLWNTAYSLARHSNTQVWPLLDGEIWHGEPDAA